MESTEGGSTPGETPVETVIQQYLDSVEAGNTRKNFQSTLTTWQAWLRDERGVTILEDLEVIDSWRYARHLKQRVRDRGLKASTATTYYAYVRAFLTFCVADKLIETNPAKAQRATDELPEDLGDSDRQFWQEEDRQAIMRYADERAHEALEEDTDVSRGRAFRDRAIVYLLGLSGVRGAEVFSEPSDDKRTGITWRDVELEAGAVRVLGKSREYEYAQLPERAATALERYKTVLASPTDEWPVFPTGHAPSKYRAVREQLADDGISEDEIEELLDQNDVETVLRDHNVVPPALSTNGARNVMQRLYEAADIDVDSDYLKPHGAAEVSDTNSTPAATLNSLSQHSGTQVSRRPMNPTPRSRPQRPHSKSMISWMDRNPSIESEFLDGLQFFHRGS